MKAKRMTVPRGWTKANPKNVSRCEAGGGWSAKGRTVNYASWCGKPPVWMRKEWNENWARLVGVTVVCKEHRSHATPRRGDE